MSNDDIIDTAVGTCRVRRSRRRTLAISVLPNGDVELSAPVDASVAVLRQKVRRRLRWILTQRRIFADLHVSRSTLRFVSGATHRYLGRQYRLKVKAGVPEGVRLVQGQLRVTVTQQTEAAVQRAVAAWYRAKAREQFSARLAKWAYWCHEQNLPEPHLRLLRMPKRWGSSHCNGSILLNPALVKAPAVCIDYVIAHEICHLRHPHHARAFFRLLDQLCPHWSELKHRLESIDL